MIKKSNSVVVQDLLLAPSQEEKVRKGRAHDTPGRMARLTSPTSLPAMSNAPTIKSALDVLFLQDKWANLMSVPLPSVMRGALSHQTKMECAFAVCATSS